MQAIYPYAQIVHLFCAIIFIGYLFFDVVVMRFVAKSIDRDIFSRMANAIESKITRFMPLVVLVLFLSGGMMASSYIGLEAGFCTTTFQKVFMLRLYWLALYFC